MNVRVTKRRTRIGAHKTTGNKKARTSPRFLFAGKAAEGPYQAENEEPQPQVVVAFGFLITNWAPSRSSL